MGFIKMFRKSLMKNAFLPKISILSCKLFEGEILSTLCFDDPQTNP